MRRSWPFVILIPCALLIGLALFAPREIHRVAMSSETDGYHQDDHLYLGFVPYSTSRRDPRINVTQDARTMLKEAGVPDLPESHRSLPYAPLVRCVYPAKTEYVLQFDLNGKSRKEIADRYAHALKGSLRRSNSFEESVEGVGRDGKTHVSFTAFQGVSAPAQLRFWRSP